MPVSAAKLVYDFRRKYDSINSGNNRDISLVDIIAYLNEAQEKWYENRILRAQTNDKVRDDLRVWKRDRVSLRLSNHHDGAVIGRYPADLYKRLNQVVLASKSCCPNMDKEIIPRMIQSDDLHEARFNPYRGADFFFEQASAIETANGLIVYHDGEFVVEKLFIDYYRRPKEIHAPSLEECDGDYYYNYNGEIIQQDQPFEGGDTYAANDIVDLAVLMAHRDMTDPGSFQTQMNQILGSQDLHK